MAQPTSTPSGWTADRITNLALGAVMALAGIFLLISLNNELEIVVLIAGPIIMAWGLVAILVVFFKNRPNKSATLGALAVALGAILFIHDLAFPPAMATIAHAGSGVAILIVGIAQLLGRPIVQKLGRRKTA